MTLQEIFNRINANYNTVKSLTNSIYNPYKIAIDTHWNKAKLYAGRLDWRLYHNWTEFAGAVKNYGYEVVWLLEDFIDEMFLTAGSVKSKLQSVFNTYMAHVVTDVENAIEFVQTEMYSEVDFLADTVNAAIIDMQEYLDAEVSAMHAEIDLLSIDVVGWIDAAVAELADTLNMRIEEVNTNLTARVDFLETWTADTIQAVYNYVDRLNAEMIAYIDIADNTIYNYINNRVKELENNITSVQLELNARITSEVNALSDSIAIVEISLTDKINELIETTGWNFTFFDLFTFKPELSLIRVLLRSDTEFERYKPYWQALFARVLEEE